MKPSVSASKKKKRPVTKKANGNLQVIDTRLQRVEDEIAAIRRELVKARLPVATKRFGVQMTTDLPGFWADNSLLRHAADKLFRVLDIVGNPIPAEELQQLMSVSGLETNELSQSLILAREE